MQLPFFFGFYRPSVAGCAPSRYNITEKTYKGRYQSMKENCMDSKMFEIDRAAFGAFVAERRRALGWTQKELAVRLFVSDKAVSKWERGLSMPDISLLIPLARLLQVSVTELLEGRRLEQNARMDAGQVEDLVQKALTLTEEPPEKKKEKLRRHALFFSGCTMLSLAELLLGIWLLHRAGVLALSSSLLTLEGLSLCFGIYAWFFMKERLPAYYDENKINAYSDGVFRINLPGDIRFNNSNWPHIVRFLRRWTAVTMLLAPLLCILASFVHSFWLNFGLQQGALILYLCTLFVPMYALAKKYQ